MTVFFFFFFFFFFFGCLNESGGMICRGSGGFAVGSDLRMEGNQSSMETALELGLKESGWDRW